MAEVPVLQGARYWPDAIVTFLPPVAGLQLANQKATRLHERWHKSAHRSLTCGFLTILL